MNPITDNRPNNTEMEERSRLPRCGGLADDGEQHSERGTERRRRGEVSNMSLPIDTKRHPDEASTGEIASASDSSSSSSSSDICSLAATAREAKQEAAAAVTNDNNSNPATSSSSAGEQPRAHHHRPHHRHEYGIADPVAALNHTRVLAYEAFSQNSGDEASATSHSGKSLSLLDPYSEPCFHTIRKTFHRFQQRTKNSDGRKSAVTSSSASHDDRKPAAVGKSTTKKRSRALLLMDDDENSSDGSEGGYAGSASSNAEDNRQAMSGSGEDSSEESGNDAYEYNKQEDKGPRRKLLRPKVLAHNNSSSSEIADFSSTDESTGYATAPSPLEEDGNSESSSSQQHRHGTKHSWNPSLFDSTPPQHRRPIKKRRLVPAVTEAPTALLEGKTPILALGRDIMAHVLTFLEPPDVLDVLTMPLSKDWLSQYTRQPELWRVLCVLEPFKANVERKSGYDSDDDDAFIGLFPFSESALLFASDKQTFGKYRLLYSSFVKCMRYLIRIKDDSVNGRPLSVVALAQDNLVNKSNLGANQNLQQFLSQARGASTVVQQVASQAPVGLVDNGIQVARKPPPPRIPTSKSITSISSNPKKVKYGHSKLTQRLLGPSVGGSVTEIELPWSCAIYSIVNWMVAFSGVEGIQTMCLKVLPFLLEDEQQRITAQRVGLTDIILRSMLLFRNSTKLHTAAFHTIVLLARPLGGREGMLFHTSMVNASGIFGSNGRSSSSSSGDGGEEGGTEFSTSASSSSANGKSGIAVLLDSMRRFRRDKTLQSMGCWSLVNIALAPAQKEVLVKLGGIEVTAEAMTEHPFDAEVQFRALFALINLVIPCTTNNNNNQEDGRQTDSGEESSESDVLDDMVDQIIDLVVLSIKNFCANEAILNRACLVLHNISLTPSYHAAMLQTPTCYQMLEWCLGNFRTDQVLQQSAAGTLHRLQVALSNDVALRSRFALAVHAMQRESLKQAHHEAVTLSEEEDRQLAASTAAAVEPEQ